MCEIADKQLGLSEILIVIQCLWNEMVPPDRWEFSTMVVWSRELRSWFWFCKKMVLFPSLVGNQSDALQSGHNKMRSGADLRGGSPLVSFNHVIDPHFVTFSSSLYTTIRNPNLSLTLTRTLT